MFFANSQPLCSIRESPREVRRSQEFLDAIVPDGTNTVGIILPSCGMREVIDSRSAEEHAGWEVEYRECW